jgi:hypothetical protein
MSPWHATEHYGSDRACCHVLVIGVSEYAALPADSASADPALLGLTRVKSPAISAYRFATWVRDNYHSESSPLGSIRLLLAPSQAEIDNEPELLTLREPVPNRDNVKQALLDWQTDCAGSIENTAIMYAAGHGLRMSGEMGILLLEDFAAPGGNLLDGAIDIGNICSGMDREGIAENQFYFIDACAIEPRLFQDYIHLPTGVRLDALRGGHVKSSPIFFGAMPESVALGEPGKGTLFIQALLQCLACDAAIPDDPNDANKWLVYTQNLFSKLRLEVNRLAESFGDEQFVVLGGLSADSLFHQLPEPPKVPLSVSVAPPAADQHTHYTLTYLPTDEVVYEQNPFTSPSTRYVVPGVYKLEFKVESNTDYHSNEYPALIVGAPSTKCEVQV